MSEATSPQTVDALLPELAELIVAALNLDMDSAEIVADAPLFGDAADSLGLDSIDVLEIALVVSKRFGFQLKSDNPAPRTNTAVSSSTAPSCCMRMPSARCPR